MTDISTVRTDLLSIVGNNRMPIKTKRILIKRFLKAINTFIDLKPNKIYNLKKKKINKILSLLPSIKYNVDLKKLLTKELIFNITDFENYPNIIFDKEKDDTKELIMSNLKPKIKFPSLFQCYTNDKLPDISDGTWKTIKVSTKDPKVEIENNVDKSNLNEANKDILIEKVPVESEEDSEVESENSNGILNSDSDTEEESECEQDSDETDEDTDESEIDSDSDTEELDGTVNNLVDDLADDAKAKLLTKMTKYKLEHVFKMEAEKNRNMERMEELAIKKLKVKNKYKLKKLENRK
jgi:hypothetical protein